MKLVLLFFCGFLILIITILTLIILSKVKLNIKKCNITNIQEAKKKKVLDKEIAIYVEFYLLGVVKIARIKLTKSLIEKLKIKNDFKSIEKDIEVVKSVHPLEIIKKLKIRTEKIRLYLAIGTESVMLTVNLVTIFASLIRNSI